MYILKFMCNLVQIKTGCFSPKEAPHKKGMKNLSHFVSWSCICVFSRVALLHQVWTQISEPGEPSADIHVGDLYKSRTAKTQQNNCKDWYMMSKIYLCFVKKLRI